MFQVMKMLKESWPGLCIHIISYQKKFQSFPGHIVAWPPFFVYTKDLSEKYKGNIAIGPILLPFLHKRSNQLNFFAILLHLHSLFSRYPYWIYKKGWPRHNMARKTLKFFLVDYYMYTQAWPALLQHFHHLEHFRTP